MLSFGASSTGQKKRIAVALGLALSASVGGVMGAEQPTEDQILKALNDRGPARGAHAAVDRERSAQEQSFIAALLKKKPRTITLDERRRVAEIARDRPSIDLDIPFEYNSVVIGTQAVPVLVALGRALGNTELAGATFLIAGHTDGKGGDAYNQGLSERRAAAVKQYLAAQFKLAPERLLAIGFGKTELKNAADPLAAENRRVQVVNTEVK